MYGLKVPNRYATRLYSNSNIHTYRNILFLVNHIRNRLEKKMLVKLALLAISRRLRKKKKDSILDVRAMFWILHVSARRIKNH